nr:forkhead box protein J1 A [Hymenolepis microstoma]
MAEVRVLPRDSVQKLTSDDLNGTNSKPNSRNHLSAYNGTQVSTLAQRFRENWLKCNPSFRDMDDSLTNLNWLFEMNPFSLESENFGVNRNSKFAIDRSSWSLLDPQVRLDYRTKWTGKPPFSYASLICLAMRELGKPKVTLSDIYGWIMANFAYYRHTDSSWQNSVRHNLSLNKCFEKVPREKGERGKGGFWRVNPRHADWLEANLAKCRRAAPPPGPPPPIPRSLLLEKQQEQSQQLHQTTDGIYLAFSSPNATQAASIYHATQPNQTHQTFICYRSVSVPPDVSNEIETVTVKRTASDVVYQNQPQQQQIQQPQPQPHVRRRKTPPCSMYSSAEPDLVEVDPKTETSPQSNTGNYSAFSNRKRLALTARQRLPQMWSQSGGYRKSEENSYSEQRSWRIDSNLHYGVRKRRDAEMENSDFCYHSSTKRYHNQQHSYPYNNGASNYSYSTTSDCSKHRVETQLRHHTQTPAEDHSSPILSEHISLPCLDSLPSIAEESDIMDTSNDPWKEDLFDFNALPWQTISDSNNEQSNLTVQCNTPEDSNNSASNHPQNSSSSSPSPLASFTSFGQSVASSITSSNTDSGVASLVNPSDSLDLGPLDLDFDTVSSTLNDLVESTSCAIPPIDVDFGAELSDSMPRSLETPPTSENRDYDDPNWNFGVGEGGFFENGLSLG